MGSTTSPRSAPNAGCTYSLRASRRPAGQRAALRCAAVLPWAGTARVGGARLVHVYPHGCRAADAAGCDGIGGVVTAQAQAEQDLASLPALTLDTRQLGDLELILSGAFAPLTGFMTAADVASVTDSATLIDGTPWPVPVTLEVPATSPGATADRVLLADPEGTPLAVLTVSERTASPRAAGLVQLAGPVE